MANRSFIKWAGGKGAIVEEIKKYLSGGKRLIEPFVGAGNVFINTDYREYFLNDINSDLINVYDNLCSRPDYFIVDLAADFIAGNSENVYRQARDHFNSLATAFMDPAKLSYELWQKALLFVYLNRHGYGGICRYNSSGKFNVPYGKNKTVYFPESELRMFADKLQRNVIVSNYDFEEVINEAGPGDDIYCDPPYLPKSKTANFVGYHSSPFGIEQHKRLNAALVRAVSRGAKVVLSNSDTPETREIYKYFDFHTVNAPRSITQKGGDGKRVNEVIAVLDAEILAQFTNEVGHD
ncbi:Dam family site-specific DNA-(adenine-N6)-methyltransferase [Limnobaculum xujianqingii]|uniref:Dam family site-specific DNA-(adenine-N6)-methyltransferase n=1 Tax=Limnobaculum xujianqingii TaxID=2738837 RepID=UPI0015B8B1B1|nr:Dam family site-specific DNA-(adenine-N6)-methyltransferase [Limnobaculum xujianqingii]